MNTSANKIQFMFEGSKHEIEIREDRDFTARPWNFKRTTARAFVWSSKVDVSTDGLEQKAKELGLETIHTSKGDSKEMDRAWRAYNKLERELQERLLTVGLEAAGIQNVQMKFSRYAGCSCPCSPGFILNGGGLFRATNVYINEIKEEKVVPNRANLVLED